MRGAAPEGRHRVAEQVSILDEMAIATGPRSTVPEVGAGKAASGGPALSAQSPCFRLAELMPAYSMEIQSAPESCASSDASATTARRVELRSIGSEYIVI